MFSAVRPWLPLRLRNHFDPCTSFSAALEHPHLESDFSTTSIPIHDRSPQEHHVLSPSLTLCKSHPWATEDASHPRFPLGLHGVHQAFPWSWWTALFPALSHRICPGRFTSLSLGSPPLPPASEVLDVLFHAMWARPFSRLLRPILVGDQQLLPSLAKSCDP